MTQKSPTRPAGDRRDPDGRPLRSPSSPSSLASSSSLPGPDGARHGYITVHRGTERQVRLHVAEFGEGAPLVLLHGIFQYWLAWRHVLALLPNGYRAVCVDLRGFGWSEQTRTGYDLGTLAEDVSALITELELGPVAVVGHDLGAQVALRLAVDRPQDCAGLLAVNTHHPFPSRLRMAANLWRMWFTALLEYPVLGPLVIRRWPRVVRGLLRRAAHDRGAWSAEELGEFTEATRASARPTQQVLWRHVLKEMPRMLRGRGVARLTVPTILLSGSRDAVVPPRLLSGDAARAALLDARLVPDCGHQLPLEAPARIVAAIAELERGR